MSTVSQEQVEAMARAYLAFPAHAQAGEFGMDYARRLMRAVIAAAAQATPSANVVTAYSEALASSLAKFTDEQVNAALDAMWPDGEIIYADKHESAEAGMRAALDAAVHASRRSDLSPNRSKEGD